MNYYQNLSALTLESPRQNKHICKTPQANPQTKVLQKSLLSANIQLIRIKVTGLTILTLFTLNLFGQIQQPQTPTFKNFNPVSPTKSYTTEQKQYQHHNQKNNQYKSAIQPKKANEIAAKNYFLPDNIYNTINKNNYLLTSTNSIPNKENKSVQLIYSITKEISTYETSISYQFPSLQSQPGANNFNQAYDELIDMLEGRKPLDLKRAVFITENAFFGNTMNYNDYVKTIKEMTLLIQLKIQQENLPMNNQTINYMTHQFISDTLKIKLTEQEQTITTYPKTYDFDDPFGYKDVRKMFVSKLIAEYTGQCKSLPLLYLILVNELGGNAYLSFSPSHSFVKCKDSHNSWYNLELTNGMLTSNSWLVGSGYIKAEAVKSGIFLDTLNKQQIIAHCLVDLAQYYGWRYNGYDEFVLKCVNKALEYNPSDIWAIQVKSDYYTLLFMYVAQQLGYTTIEQLKNNPKALELFMQRNRIYALIDGLGYKPMPDQAYLDWLQTLNEKQQQQENDKQYIKFSKIVR